MNAPRTDEGVIVPGGQTKRYVALDSPIPTSNWNKPMLNGRMISLEDGVPLSRTIADLWAGSIKLASGIVITAIHDNLRGAFDVDFRYDETWT